MSSIKARNPRNYINLLPSEVLAYIFTLFQDLNEDKIQNQTLTTPVYTLGQVNKTWYSVALSIPQLWASISFRIPGSSAPNVVRGTPRSDAAERERGPGDLWRSNVRSLVGFLKRWFNRSGNLPLKISVVHPTFVDHYGLWYPDSTIQSRLVSSITRPLSLHPIIELLNSYSRRWLTLRLINFPAGLLDQFKSVNDLPNSEDRPALQELSISNAYGFQDSTASGGAAFDPWNVKACPKRLELASISISSINICYRRLTILELHSINKGDFFKIIHQAVEIEVCLLNEVLIDDTRGSFEDIILLRNLRRFRLTSSDDNPTTILDNFTMPNLEEFTLRLDQDSDATHCIVNFLSRSHCTLQELQLSYARPTELDLVPVLECSPFLQSLVLTGPTRRFEFEEMNEFGGMMDGFFKTYIASESGSGIYEPQALRIISRTQAQIQDQAQIGTSRQFLSRLNHFRYDGPNLFRKEMLDTFRDSFNSRGIPSPSNIQVGSPRFQGPNFGTHDTAKISVTLERGKRSQIQ